MEASGAFRGALRFDDQVDETNDISLTVVDEAGSRMARGRILPEAPQFVARVVVSVFGVPATADFNSQLLMGEGESVGECQPCSRVIYESFFDWLTPRTLMARSEVSGSE